MGKVDVARSKHGRGNNCAQAVMVTWAPELGITEDEARRVAAGWGTGAKVTCGALYSAKEIARRLRPQQASEMEAELERRFEDANGAVNCRELLALRRQTGITCRDLVTSAAGILEEMLG